MYKAHVELYIIRAFAIIAMVWYHMVLLKEYIDTGSFSGSWVAYPIALTFMFLSGVSVSLIENLGVVKRERTFRRVLVRLGVSALLVTIVTAFVLPGLVIICGILHLIFYCYLMFYIMNRNNPYCPIHNTKKYQRAHNINFWGAIIFIQVVMVLDWIRVDYMGPYSIDYTPIFPYYLIILAGYLVGLFVYGRGWHTNISSKGLPVRLLVYIGRHTLLIYLLHIPILFVAMGGLN